MGNKIVITGKRERQALAPLLRNPGEPLETPRIRSNAGIALRSAIRNLSARGIVGFNSAARKYWLEKDPADIELCDFDPLLEALRRGPIQTKDYAKHAKSIESLHVRISRLRADGHDIVSRQNPMRGRKVGRPSVTYLLINDD